MTINTTDIKGDFKINVPKKGAFTIDTDDDFMKLHTLLLCSGRRGHGKGVAIANLVRQAKAKGYFQRVLLITPTFSSNKEIWDMADIDEGDVYEPYKTVLSDIIKVVEQEKQEWEIFQERKRHYGTYSNDMKHKPLASFTPTQLIYFLDQKFFEAPPKWKYDLEVPPRLAVVIDDSLGTDLMLPSARLTNFCVKHRHIADGLGISIFMLVQSYCAKEGIARPIRENTTHLMLFKCKDENQVKKISEEIGADVDLEKFKELYAFATEDPFSFLFVDFSPKSPEKTFRKCFNQYIQ